MAKVKLTIPKLIEEAKLFCETESKFKNKELFGVTDGKAVGTFVEHKFQSYLSSKYEYIMGSSANGIDLPGNEINTDIKVTSIKQPQSSCPFKNTEQKIFGLGYNLLVFVYDKTDNRTKKYATLNFCSCSYIEKERTADYTTTKRISEMLKDGANREDIVAYLNDRNLPVDETILYSIAERILLKTPKIGYLTISNALQWRLQYQRIVSLNEKIEGITKIIDKVNSK
ncbi:MAG: restriction endonuclease [Bacteroidetes bacterium]|nr:MAG: restriction endonuclease [Bacteroidota bacterium]